MKYKIESLFFLLASYTLAPFWYVLVLVRRILVKRDAPHILIIQSARIGDMVCITPIFREIKNKYPRAYLATIVTEPATGVTLHNPYIDKFYYYKTNNGIASFLRAWFEIGPLRYDYSFNFFPGVLGNALPFWLGIPYRITTTIKVASRVLKLLFPLSNYRELYKKEESAPHHHLKLLRHIGIVNPSDLREVFSRPDAEKKVNAVLDKYSVGGERVNIAISVGCGKGFRKWPLEKFIELADRIIEEYPVNILFTGGAEDKTSIQKVLHAMRHKEHVYDVSDEFAVDELPAFFSRVKLFISVSTGPLYIADAAGCATIDIIGTDNAVNQAPQGNTVIVENKVIPSCSYVMYPPTCSLKDTQKRMDISIDSVEKAVRVLLA